MDVARLGPLDRSILKALLLAEPMGLPLTAPQMWRLLPGYSTYLSNVVAALAPGAPLSGFVCEERGQYVVRDRGHLLREFARSRQLGEVMWTRLRGPVESLCREQSIHGLALAGPMAWGFPPEHAQNTQLFVVSSPNQQGQAADAVRLASERLPHGIGLQVCELLSVDSLTIEPADKQRAMELLSLRPVLGESAFLTLWEHNSWIAAVFPNFDVGARLGGDVPDPLLAETLEDRRGLLRRSLNRRVRRFGGVLRALGRRRGQRRGEGYDSSRDVVGAALDTSLTGADSRNLFKQRWGEISDWLLADPAPVVENVDEPVSVVETEREEDVASALDTPPGSSHVLQESGEKVRPRRAARRRPARAHRAVASTETGQRGIGRRKTTRKRRSTV
jgi:hypothetical protein